MSALAAMRRFTGRLCIAASLALLAPATARAGVRVLPGVFTGIADGAYHGGGRLNVAIGDRLELGGELGKTGNIVSIGHVTARTILFPLRVNAIHFDGPTDLYLHGLLGHVRFGGDVSAGGVAYGGGVGISGHIVDGYVRWFGQFDMLAHKTDFATVSVGNDGDLEVSSALYRFSFGLDLSLPAAGDATAPPPDPPRAPERVDDFRRWVESGNAAIVTRSSDVHTPVSATSGLQGAPESPTPSGIAYIRFGSDCPRALLFGQGSTQPVGEMPNGTLVRVVDPPLPNGPSAYRLIEHGAGQQAWVPAGCVSGR